MFVRGKRAQLRVARWLFNEKKSFINDNFSLRVSGAYTHNSLNLEFCVIDARNKIFKKFVYRNLLLRELSSSASFQCVLIVPRILFINPALMRIFSKKMLFTQALQKMDLCHMSKAVHTVTEITCNKTFSLLLLIAREVQSGVQVWRAKFKRLKIIGKLSLLTIKQLRNYVPNTSPSAYVVQQRPACKTRRNEQDASQLQIASNLISYICSWTRADEVLRSGRGGWFFQRKYSGLDLVSSAALNLASGPWTN